MGEIGEFLGWLTVFSFGATLANYILKYINKKYSKLINSTPEYKKINALFMKIFVRHHKFWGFATIITLLLHFYIQSTFREVSTTGLIAGGILLIQMLLGMSGAYIFKKRQGLWFVSHRIISIVLILGIIIHLL